MTTTNAALPLLLEEVEVASVERLSPGFTRVELACPAFAELGVGERSYDQRVKVLFPSDAGRLPSLADVGEDWYGGWLALPEDERGHLRTYTARAVRGSGSETRLVVDFVVHEGATGPAGRWADRAGVGDRVVVLAPRRGHEFGGIEFVPGDAERLLLVGDETAVPAVAAVLEQLDASARGAVFLEVPVPADLLTLTAPPGVEITWLPRNGAARGSALHAAVLAHLGVRSDAPVAELVAVDEVDPDLWETPTYSSSGQEVLADDTAAQDHRELYAWIAGESRVVTALRRALVNEVGLDRGQVAFMGYWREGVAMRS
jgi:NADPH-dependent ferric siderophore reductase